MRIRWLKLILTASVAEIAAVLLLICLVAVFGPNSEEAAQAYAVKLGWWVGPIAGALFSFIGAVWISRSVADGYVEHGALLGVLLTLVDVFLLVSMRTPFQWLFVISNVGKILAGILGGIAGRLTSAKA